MELHLEWTRAIALKDATGQNDYSTDLGKLPPVEGIYIFGREWGMDFEALYIGKADNIRSRVKGQFNNHRLMQHLGNAKRGKRVILAGRFIAKPGQQLQKCLGLIERAFIRHFLSEGHDLVNKQGIKIRRHEIDSSGKQPKRIIAPLIYLEKT